MHNPSGLEYIGLVSKKQPQLNKTMPNAKFDKAIKFTATLPNGTIITRSSKRPLVAVHASIDKDTNECWHLRWTEIQKPLEIATAASCGVTFGFRNLNRCYSPQQKAEARQDNLRAEEAKRAYENSHTFVILPVVAA